MLIQQKQLWLYQGGHQKGSAPDAARRTKAPLWNSSWFPVPDLRISVFLHTMLSFFRHTPTQCTFFPACMPGARSSRFPYRPPFPHRIWKHPADVFGTAILRLSGNIDTVSSNASIVDRIHTCYHIEQCGLARTVSSDHSDKLSGFRCRFRPQSAFFSLIVPLLNVLYT